MRRGDTLDSTAYCIVCARDVKVYKSNGARRFSRPKEMCLSHISTATRRGRALVGATVQREMYTVFDRNSRELRAWATRQARTLRDVEDFCRRMTADAVSSVGGELVSIEAVDVRPSTVSVKSLVALPTAVDEEKDTVMRAALAHVMQRETTYER